MTDIASPAIVPGQARRRLKVDPLLLAVPGILFLVLFLIFPTAQVLSLSLVDRVTGALTFAAFTRIWNGGPYLSILLTTFSVSLSTAAFAGILGTLVLVLGRFDRD